MVLQLRQQLISLDKPIIMGILNLTPDSFYEESRLSEKKAIQKAEQMLCQGATILDIGGYSTRPNAEEVTIEEEINRTVPFIGMLRNSFPEALISIDTFRSEVAKVAVEAGADLINDVSGGNLDTQMFETVAALNVPYVLMHMRGTPQTMQSLTNYENLVLDVFSELAEKINILEELGVRDIIIDLGFGFAKNLKQNYQLLQNLSAFKELNRPLLVGVSRKSMIYKALGITPQEALNGTSVLHTIAVQKGANLLRVHDVKEAKEVIELSSLMQ